MHKTLFTLLLLLFLIPVASALKPTITPFAKTIEIGETARFTTNLQKNNGVFWAVNHPEVIQILQSSGDFILVKAVKKGQGTITLKTEKGERASVIVYVGDVQNVNKAKRKIGAAQEVVLSPQQRTVPVGESISFIAKRAKERVFEWSVDNEKIVRIQSTVGTRARVEAQTEGVAHVFARAKDGSVGDAVVRVVAAEQPTHTKGLQTKTSAVHSLARVHSKSFRK